MVSSRVFLMKIICRSVLKDYGDMEQHITDFLNNINKLAALGQHLTDELQAVLLLQSLPDSYDPLVATLEGRPDKDLTVDLVKGKLIDEYKKRLGSKYTKENYDSEAAMKSTFKDKSNGWRQSKKSCFFLQEMEKRPKMRV